MERERTNPQWPGSQVVIQCYPALEFVFALRPFLEARGGENYSKHFTDQIEVPHTEMQGPPSVTYWYLIIFDHIWQLLHRFGHFKRSKWGDGCGPADAWSSLHRWTRPWIWNCGRRKWARHSSTKPSFGALELDGGGMGWPWWTPQSCVWPIFASY